MNVGLEILVQLVVPFAVQLNRPERMAPVEVVLPRHIRIRNNRHIQTAPLHLLREAVLVFDYSTMERLYLELDLESMAKFPRKLVF